MKRRFGALILLTALVFTLVGCGLIVERPEVKEGEFNFSVTHEINGEIKTISGVYVCEYDGIDRVLDGVDHREWKGYIKDGTTEEQIKLATAEDGGVVELNLHFAPEYFMGESYGDDDEPFSPSTLTLKICPSIRRKDTSAAWQSEKLSAPSSKKKRKEERICKKKHPHGCFSLLLFVQFCGCLRTLCAYRLP